MQKKRMKSLLLRGIDRFAQANAVGVAETWTEGAARSVTDEESFYKET